MGSTVIVNLEPLKQFASIIENDLRRNGSGPIRRAIKQWGRRYRAFARERFDKFSKGGGDWQKLADSTKKRRRGKTYSILKDTEILFAALTPTFQNRPGQFEQDIPFGIRVGYGGPGRHPVRSKAKTKKGRTRARLRAGKGGFFRAGPRMSTATVADIAGFHNEGVRYPNGKVVKREIIVQPDQTTIDGCVEDMLRALETLGKQCEARR